MTTRRLAAILAADMVGYSRLMGADEAGTLGRLRALRGEVIDFSVNTCVKLAAARCWILAYPNKPADG